MKYPREAGGRFARWDISPWRRRRVGSGSESISGARFRIGQRDGPKRSAHVSAEVGCSPRLAGEARPGFCRECNRRRQHFARADAAAGCTPGRFLVASGARRGGQPTGPPPPNRQPAGQKTPCFPEPGPPEAPLTLTSLTINNRQEPTRTQAQATARVEDDRREDEPTARGAQRTWAVAQRRATTSASESSYEARHGAERSVGAVGEPEANGEPSADHHPLSRRKAGPPC